MFLFCFFHGNPPSGLSDILDLEDKLGCRDVVLTASSYFIHVSVLMQYKLFRESSCLFRQKRVESGFVPHTYNRPGLVQSRAELSRFLGQVVADASSPQVEHPATTRAPTTPRRDAMRETVLRTSNDTEPGDPGDLTWRETGSCRRIP